MVLPRPSAMRGFAPARLLRSSVRSANRAVARRGYASGHGHEAPSSDLPWIIGSTALTVPAVWYLWPEASHGDAQGAHSAHDSHKEEHKEEEQPEEEESKEEEQPKEEAKEEPKEESKDEPKEESKDEPKEESKDEKPKEEPKEESKDDKPKEPKGEPVQDEPQANAKPAADESKSKSNTEGANQPEKKGDVDGVKFKGPTNEGDEEHRMPDERKREPDGKGAFKKRIDSGYGKNLGSEPDSDSEDIAKKQGGLSNTPTRHSTDITQDPQMSKKGEGSPDTAKSQGTVKVDRPTPENRKFTKDE